MWRAFLHLHLQDSLLLVHFLSLALLTSRLFIDFFACSRTVIARSLPLRVHSWSKLHHNHFDSATFAAAALLHCICAGAAYTLALAADSVSRHCNLRGFSVVDILEVDFQWMQNRLALSRTLMMVTTAAAAKHFEDVAEGVSTASAGALLEVVLA